MSTDSLLHHFDDIRFTAEEQDVYGNWLNANLKKKQENPAPPKGRIRFHEEGDSSNSQSDFSTLCDDLVFGGVLFTTDFTPVAFVDAAPICAFPEPTPVSSPLAAPPTAAYVDDGEDDDVLEENDDPDVPVQDKPPVKIPAKRSSGG
ncbi:hypothetical protein V6N11_051133 [Hibiscus sabdariffa]|uniref:Uncharacterized protein n=1 Tax=Hibiscus sabdariffa TaxID=183260 RepID=A0ABR2R2Z7_9ROSI